MLTKKIDVAKPTGWVYRVLWSRHPLRALGEGWLAGMLLFFALSRLVGSVSAFVLSNGILFLCAVCGMWVALRARLVAGTLVRQTLLETGLGLLVSVMMAVGLVLPARRLGWDAVWQQSTFGPSVGFISLLFAMTGPGYLVARVGARVWLLWEHLRRRRMVWSLTHAHLTVVLIVGICGLIISLGAVLFTSPPASSDTAPDNVFAIVAALLLHSFFPALAVMTVFLGMTLVGVLPFSLLVSFLIARKTTRRLEQLVAATGSLRAGDYTTRVAVAGEDEVAQLQTTFNAMAADLEHTLHDLQVERDRVAALLRARRELVANVSHELRTPLATIRGYLDTFQAADWPESRQRDLEVMERELLHLQTLIGDLFTLSRAEIGGLTLDLRPVDVIPVIRRRVEALAPLARQREHVEVIADVPTELPPALADAERLDQVLANLLRNALRHTPPGGIIAVVASAEDAHIHIKVCDTGEGIPPEELPHVWERFYRGASARELDAQGAGLGLALVKDLVEAMGGAVDVRSAPGEGSCFGVNLPRG